MIDKFIEFMTTPGPDSFRAAREAVVSDAGYEPYSDDLKILNDLFVEEAYQEIAAYKSINILLSPTAHLIKSVAYEKLGMQQESESEMYMWQTILKTITSSGDGSLNRPFLVTRISDEQDILEYFGEELSGQRIIQYDGKSIERIDTVSGNKFFFNVSDCLPHAAPPAKPVEKPLKDIPLEIVPPVVNAPAEMPAATPPPAATPEPEPVAAAEIPPVQAELPVSAPPPAPARQEPAPVMPPETEETSDSAYEREEDDFEAEPDEEPVRKKWWKFW